ncbi:hypothetical protein F443_05183 [Phytophthora nicotianae P1569]|uniref:SWIM-type domain-containing protein n=1 Tax=Phytophthora nicotianae P1569 TaxID=1317065 RepID=V9FK41_PHYNI|nr:hypothetical protein F443_05183 [Phytophthora nicotianae P1569]
MEVAGQPEGGWNVDLSTNSCGCKYYFKFAICIHVLFALQKKSYTGLDEAIKRLLDAVPKSRITKSRLIEAAALGDDAGEAEWVLPTGTNLRGLPTYQMRTILADRRINGRVQFLTSWEPTWEPAVNLHSNKIRMYRRRQRHRVDTPMWKLKLHKNNVVKRQLAFVNKKTD